MSRDETTVADLILAAERILAFTVGMDHGAFLADLKTQSAVLHQFLVLGEGVKRLSQPFREAHPSVPWSLIARMRDQLIHHYEVVDLDVVWNSVTKDMPGLPNQLRALLPADPRLADPGP